METTSSLSNGTRSPHWPTIDALTLGDDEPDEAEEADLKNGQPSSCTE